MTPNLHEKTLIDVSAVAVLETYSYILSVECQIVVIYFCFYLLLTELCFGLGYHA